ncbi:MULTISPECIES: hypothetical protein [Pontibacillus]|uniref:Uncharacterized protein n=1 Tax=Pontibacillus chungwhensis TaxID=265426 RepID=A0ABY8V1W7_9BACI|nr:MULTISPECIES: hypothetical protein [Pontibacillus]MCD5324455.1 hypothetical protein [Pontibacillus sp. HN14]WIF99252.1 hypothetical protein QNI29_06210 [Pontibacillus chungwhensis]
MIGEIGSLRVRVRPEYLPLYKQLLRNSLIKQHSEFFTLCCFMTNSKGQLDEQVNLTELCQANSFTEYQLTSLSALAYKHNQELLFYKELFQQMEQEADKGFTYLIENVWSNLVSYSEGGEVTIIPGREFEAQYLLAAHVSREMEEVPF